MRLLYNILFAVGFTLSAPYYFWKMRRRGHWQAGFGQRFGRYDEAFVQSLAGKRVLWLHAVSVGEVSVCTQLLQTLRPQLKDFEIVVSTTTSTGMGLLRDKLPAQVHKVYYPVDGHGAVKRALRAIHPEAVVLVEAEIWPNFLWRLRDEGVPVFLVNARLSERSFRGYQRFGFLFRPLFASFAGVGAQNDDDAARLRALGCRDKAVTVIGSLKYDAASTEPPSGLDVPAMFRQLGWPEDALVLVAGSTHAGEETLLAGMCARLRERFPRLRLVLVPRHFERARAVGEELAAQGVKFVFRDQLAGGRNLPPGEADCLMVNTTGELRHFYAHATVVFVGKSLTAEGGQNPIEPAALGRAMVFGPNMQNFTAIAEEFVAAQGAVQVADAAALQRELAALLAEPARREELGRKGLEVVRRNQGGIERTARLILSRLAKGGSQQ